MDNNITTKLIWRWIKYLLNKNKKIKLINKKITY